MNYLLIDYENVQPKSLARLKGQSFKIFVFVGANQKVRPDFSNALQEFGGDVKHIQISGSGHNALDFHIAFTMGELAKSDAQANFRIISKDKGFTPLIKYLEGKGIAARRLDALQGSGPGPQRVARIVSNPLEVVVNRLSSLKARPGSEKTLRNWIRSQPCLAPDDSTLQRLVCELEVGGHIFIENGRVTYPSTPLTLVR